MLYDGYNQQTVGIVNAFSSGHLLGPAFRARGVQVVHVTNRNAALYSQIATFHSHDFRASLDFAGDVSETARNLSVWRVRHVVAGTKSGQTG